MPEDQLNRVRDICFKFPETTERLSHGSPTFFAGKRVFVMFSDNHHNDGRIAVWLSAAPGFQEMLIESSPQTYFKPPYVGVRGWIGINLEKVSDADLQFHILNSWQMVAPKKLLSKYGEMSG